MAVGSFDGLDESLLKEVVNQGSLDFDTWTTLISSIEQLHPDDIDKISLVYDLFLSEFPLCYGYWKRYAEHTARLCNVDNVVQVFERAVKSAPYCVGVWVDYCTFSMTAFEDPLDVCRLFERGLSFVGKDYLCHTLWDKYIEFEYSHERWNSLASIYVQTLKFPTKKLHQYYESFKKLVAIWKKDIKVQESYEKEKDPEHDMDSETVSSRDDELSHVVNELVNPSTRTKALEKYISVGECYYQKACDLESKVKKFEQSIHRPYYHVKPLDDSQLHTWHQYLDLVEMEGDFDWAVKLYERCLISCAHYPDFWMRYVDYVESKGGREMALDALERATQIFLKSVAEIHLFSAWFKEKIGDYDGVEAAFVQCDHDFGSSFVDTIRRKANIQRRMGNYAKASSIYNEALDLATEKRPDALPLLYVHFARHQYIITNNVEATQEILLNAIKRVPFSMVLLKELIHFALMHDGARKVDLLDSVMAKVFSEDVSHSLSNEDQEEISRLYLEFIDSCGSIDDLRRAWNHHLKNFPEFVRVQSSFKKSAKSGAIWDLAIEARFKTLGTHPDNSVKNHDQNHMIVPPHLENQLVAENIDKSGKTIHKLTQFGDGNTLEIESTKSCPNDRNFEVVKDFKSYDIEEDHKLDQKSQRDKEDSMECDYASRSIPRENSPPNEKDKILSISSPRDNKESLRMRLKEPSTSSPDHPLDKEGNQHQINSLNKGRSRLGSPSNSGERRERSLSPRRRNFDRRHRERSLSPRRNNPRWHSDDRWHRDGRHRRFNRYQDNPRNFRDGRMNNQNKVGVGNKGAQQQQSSGPSSQAQAQAQLLPNQPLAYPQPQMGQYPLPSNDQYGNLQNNQLYNQMWQYYYYNQQQQPQGQQLPLNSGSQAQMQTIQQLQQTPQLVQLTYQQQQFYQNLQFQQPPNDQQQLQLNQQIPVPQQVYLQKQSQQEQEDQQVVQIQQPQQTQEQLQQQQAYQQQYLLYLQQLHQYQQSIQQPGLAGPDQKVSEEHKKDQKVLPEVREDEGSGSVLAAPITSPKKQDQGIDHIHGATTTGIPAQDELPEIEGTDI